MMAEPPDHNDHWPDSDSGHDGSFPVNGRTFFSTWGWPLFGLAAFVIFELTASLMWSSLVFALRFGWKDAYAGWFFWMNDISSARGIASVLIYLTLAMGKVIIAGFVIGMLLVNVVVPQGQQQGMQVESAVVAMAKLMLGTMVSSGVFGVSALAICLRSGRRIWVDQRSYRQAMDGIWPPLDCTTNCCHYTCFLTMISLTGLFLGLTTVIPLYLAERLMLGNSAWILLLLLVPTMCSIPFFYWGQAWIIKSVRATTPQACWPELLDQTEQDELGAA